VAAQRKQEGNIEQAMEVYKKLGTPGAPHKLLAHMAGSWSTKIRNWTSPDVTPMEWSGSSEQRMVLDGRYLHQEFAGEMMGQPYQGIGFTGYDNHLQRYVSTWMDSMSTGIMYFEGTASADGKTIIQTAGFDDPVRGPMQWRSVTSILGDNTMLFEMYSLGESGQEKKMMEITYTRNQ